METKITSKEIKRIFEEELGINWDSLKRLVKQYEREQRKKDKIKKLTGKEKVVRAMKVSRTFTPVEIAKLSGLKYKVVVNYICDFVKKGIVTKIGKKGKRQYYKVIKEL